MTNKRKYKRFRNGQKKDARICYKKQMIEKQRLKTLLFFRKYAFGINTLCEMTFSL